MLRSLLAAWAILCGQAAVVAVAQPLPPRQVAPMIAAALAERHVLEATLASGVRVSHVVYRRERLGGRWLLQLRRQSGLTITARDGTALQALRQDDFDALASRLLAIIAQQHGGRLDAIQIDATLIEPVWRGWVRHARQRHIAPAARTPSALQDEMRDYLAAQPALDRLCRQVAGLQRSCAPRPVSLDPPTFKPEDRHRPRGAAIQLPGAGFQTDGLWFSVDLVARNPAPSGH